MQIGESWVGLQTFQMAKFVILSMDDLERRTQVLAEFSEQELELLRFQETAAWCAMVENMQLLSADVLTTVKPVKDDTLLLIACLVVFLAMKSLIVNCRFILKQTNDCERNFIYC